DPTCMATRRLESSSRIMMQRLLKNARAYGNNRAARPTIPERLPATANPDSAIVPSLHVETEGKRSSVHHIRPGPMPTTDYPPRRRGLEGIAGTRRDGQGLGDPRSQRTAGRESTARTGLYKTRLSPVLDGRAVGKSRL